MHQRGFKCEFQGDSIITIFNSKFMQIGQTLGEANSAHPAQKNQLRIRQVKGEKKETLQSWEKKVSASKLHNPHPLPAPSSVSPS